ncbi:MAG: hypothetical protein COA42_20060 [Alteromonadaceae bacterium]|nr:MAG: hypothetical protein COA42_20060 [Alteromonadaceae bacterium]
MLPEALSNGLCSLNPNTDRLAMVCEMTINSSGKMTDYQFSEGIIHSHARLTYKQVNALLTEPESRLGKQVLSQHEEIEPYLLDLYDLYDALRAARDKRGAIDFETAEVQFTLSADRKIEAIKPVIRNDAHKLIEECMLCANVATAQFLEKHKLSSLYRVHDGPQQKKLETMRAFLAEKGLSLGGGKKPSPKHYDQLLRSIEQRSDAKTIQTMMLRSLGQAEYSADNLGHFGLAYTAYAHFTSPIRRYPDLLVHRAIRSVIRKKAQDGSVRKLLKSVVGLGNDHVRRIEGAETLKPGQCYPYDKEKMQSLASQCSLLSRRADKASWDVEAWLKCEYMKDRVGESFTGVISTVTSFGLFVELKDTHIEGLVHISTLKKDSYRFDAAKQCLVSESGKQNYSLGDSIKVQVSRVDLEQSKIEFMTVDQPKNRKRRSRK